MLLLFNAVTTEPLVLYFKLYFMCKGFIQNLPNTVSTQYFSSTGPKEIKHVSQYFDDAKVFDKCLYVKP